MLQKDPCSYKSWPRLAITPSIGINCICFKSLFSKSLVKSKTIAKIFNAQYQFATDNRKSSICKIHPRTEILSHLPDQGSLFLLYLCFDICIWFLIWKKKIKDGMIIKLLNTFTSFGPVRSTDMVEAKYLFSYFWYLHYSLIIYQHWFQKYSTAKMHKNHV